MGHNTQASTYKRICNLTGLEGQYSNHSGRATAATTLLKAGIPDKMALQTAKDGSSYFKADFHSVQNVARSFLASAFF